MAMTKCKECNNKVSDNAKICPSCGVESPGATHDKVDATIICVVIVVVVGAIFWWLFFPGGEPDPPKKEVTLAERYPGEWHEEFHAGISKALASNNIRGCGEFKFKPSSQNREEFVVYCTRDGKNWSAYIVWPPINQITGPHQTSPELN